MNTTNCRPGVPFVLSVMFSVAMIFGFAGSSFAQEICPQTRALIAKGDFVAAEKEAKGCEKGYPKNPEAGVLHARAVAYQGRHADALKVVREWRLRYPKDAQLATWEVRLLVWLGKPRSAWFQSLYLHKFERYADVLYVLGEVDRANKLYSQALVHYEAYLKVVPHDMDAKKRVEEVSVLAGKKPGFPKVNRKIAARIDKPVVVREQPPVGQRVPKSVRLGDVAKRVKASSPREVQICPETRELLEAGHFREAEMAAKACQKLNPGSIQPAILLLRAVAYQGRYNEALDITANLRASYPGDVDLLAWQVRLLLWNGQVREAWLDSRGLVSVENDPDVAMLIGDVEMAYGKPEAALLQYDRVVKAFPNDGEALRKRALCLYRVGRTQEARTELASACEIQGPESSACSALAEISPRGLSRRWMVGIQPGYMWVIGRPDGYNVNTFGSYKFTDVLSVGAAVDVRTREFKTGRATDVFVSGNADWRVSSWFGLSGGAGFSIAPDFSPVFAGWIEPRFHLPLDFTVYLKYWRIQFDTGGVDVISPAVDWYVGPLWFELRYYLALNEDWDAANSFAARGAWFIGDFKLGVAGGYGDRADYLEYLSRPSDSFWFVGAGVGVALPADFYVALDYSYRNETAGEDKYRFHEWILTVQKFFD